LDVKAKSISGKRWDTLHELKTLGNLNRTYAQTVRNRVDS
jgi:hypothetical protein